ncbi:MAG TPA: hypothetical protein VG204_22920 [Terriglobia bacterium]|nr:hypothetical protein [Terriglobia bacterium]
MPSDQRLLSKAAKSQRRGAACPLPVLLALLLSPAMRAAQKPAAVPPELENPHTTASIQADSQRKVKDTYHLSGHVQITYQQMRATADQITFDQSSGEITARGHVTFTDPTAFLEAEQAYYNLRSQAGWFTNARGYFHAHIRPRARMLTTENPFYVQAKKVERVDESLFLVQNGRLSSCEDEKKGWSISVRQARVIVDDKAISRGTVFHLMGVPLFYAPILVDSISRNPRQTGFLLPEVGNSTQKGYIIGDGFFWAVNPSLDLMAGAAEYSKRGVGTFGRIRARPSETSELNVDYFGVNDKAHTTCPASAAAQGLCIGQAGGESVRAVGQASDLPYGFRGVLDVDYINTLAFRLTFSDNFTQAVASEVHQRGFLTKDFDAYSLNFYVSRYQDFLSTAAMPGNSVVIQEMPSFSFSGVEKQVGQTPFYVGFDTSVAGVGRANPGFESDITDRVDFHPQITLRTKPFWGFHFTPTVGVDATRYGTSLRPDHHPIDRALGEFSADLRPPSLDKIFSKPLWGYRIKHVIEPDIRYRLVRASDREDIDNIIRYDDVDILSETNELEYSLTNSLLVRKDVPDGTDAPQAREFVSLRLTQKYYFDPTFGGALQPGSNVFQPTIDLTGFAFAQGRRLSPLVSVLKIAPSSNYDTELRADFNPSGGGVLNAGITSRVHSGHLGLAVTDFFLNKTATLPTFIVPASSVSQLPSFNLLRTVVTWGDVSRKGFSGAAGLDYNFAQEIAHQVVTQASYNFGCMALNFEYRRFALGPLRQENVYRLALSLANIGTFGNLRPRERLNVEQ